MLQESLVAYIAAPAILALSIYIVAAHVHVLFIRSFIAM